MKKKFISLVLAAVFAVSLVGCASAASSAPGSGSGSVSAPDSTATPTLNIVATTFPQYDWVRQILGEQASHVQLTLLLDDGVDLHSFQPTADDIIALSGCDLFLYVGGESDDWVEDALVQAHNPDVTVINLLDVLGDDAKQEEVVEGMQADDHDHEEGDDHDHESELDEHVWLSLRNAQLFVAQIAAGISALDPQNADTYAANAAAYTAQLAALDGEYAAVVAAATHKTVLFADRFPFRYLVDDYGLSYYAAFVGCSAETEASFETIVFLATKLDELGLPTALTIETSDSKIANTVVQSTAEKNQQILTLNSLQSVTAQDVAAGASYLGIMQDNLAVLEAALG